MRIENLKPIAVLLVLTIALAGCGGDSGSSANGDGQAASSGSDPEVRISYSGAREGDTAIANLSLFCGNEGMANSIDTLEIYMFDQPVIANLVMPADLEPGSYEIVGSDDNNDFSGKTPQFSLEWRDLANDDRADYDRGKGELVIEQMPAAQGERLVATLTMDLSSEEGETISTTVEFDGDAGSQSFDGC
jgi:hypothetical protein